MYPTHYVRRNASRLGILTLELMPKGRGLAHLPKRPAAAHQKTEENRMTIFSPDMNGVLWPAHLPKRPWLISRCSLADLPMQRWGGGYRDPMPDLGLRGPGSTAAQTFAYVKACRKPSGTKVSGDVQVNLGPA